MARPKFVLLPSHAPAAFAPLLGAAEYARVEAAARRAREQFEGRAIWHVSSTLRGGGVAEMLRSLLPYVRGAGVDTRWSVLREDPWFFRLIKRLHNDLHGDAGDGGPLEDDERATARAIRDLLVDPDRAACLGAAAHERVRRHYLGAVRLAEYGDLLAELEKRP